MEAVSKNERLDTLQRIELAEGVNIRLRVAGLPVRLLAFLIDFLICAGIMIATGILVAILIVGFDSEGAIAFYLLIWFLIRWFYHLPFEIGKKGATPGKRCMKIRVVRTTGTPVSTGQSFLRNLLRFVDELPVFSFVFTLVPTYLLGAIVMVLSKRFQRLGDLAAGTIVVYTDEHLATSPQVYAQPQLYPQYAPTTYTHLGQMVPQPPPLPLEPTMPRLPLHREEQVAFAAFKERLPLWSEGRKIELANHLAPLTNKVGPEGVREVLNIGAWFEEAK